MIWNASPRFFAKATSHCCWSAPAPAVSAPAAAEATKSAPVLPRWIRSSVSKLICLVGRQQIRRLAADQTVESDRIGQRLSRVRDASDGS